MISHRKINPDLDIGKFIYLMANSFGLNLSKTLYAIYFIRYKANLNLIDINKDRKNYKY